MDAHMIEFLKKYPCVKVFDMHVDFGDIKYVFEHNTEVLETLLPELSCICIIPDIVLDTQVTIQVTDNAVCIDRVKIKTLYSQTSSSLVVNGTFLPRGLCKLYISENMPIGIETSDTIVYIAPIE
jgi:hypothetical protein